MQVLSIQSLVAFGHVGNSAATFPLQRLGHEVWPVPTVVFSNHTGYDAWRGRALDPGEVADLIEGLDDRGVLGGVDAVLSGYLGDPGVIEVVRDAVVRVRTLNPGAVYCCDPVMGDVGRGMFVRPGLPELIRERLVPLADIVTPNHFELDFLTGTESRTLEAVVDAAESLRALGPEAVLVTSVVREHHDPDRLTMVAVTDEGVWTVETPRLPISPNGCGDLTAALFLAHLRGSPVRDLETTMRATASSVFAVLERTLAAGTRELALVASQEDIAHPPQRFTAGRLRLVE